jgi:exopolysaccharide biosynthesis polyprenyl glycosylphosphotransferase
MLRRFSADFAIFSMAVDALMVMIGLRLAVYLRPFMDEWFSFVRPIVSPPIIEQALYPLFAIFWVLVLLLFSVYDGKRSFRFVDEMKNLTNGSVMATVAIAGFLYLTFREYSRIMYFSFSLITFFLMLLTRIIFRVGFRLRSQQGGAKRRILILGAGLVGKRVAEQISQYLTDGLELVGFLDDDPLKQGNPLILGPIYRAEAIIQQKGIDEVILALPSRTWSRISSLVAKLHELPLRIWVVPDYYTLALYRAQIDELAGIPLIDLRAPALSEYQRLAKRLFDLIFTLLIMPLLLPVMGCIALAIKFDSHGPVLFRQMRVGENGRLFQMFKFRTMVDGADRMQPMIEWVDNRGHIHQDKRRPDPRITRIGRILRRTSLDELPQVFNVLRGEMSLVGPRPEMPHLVEQYEPWQRRRFAVPQGITGWWQINGRSDKPMHEHTEDDLYYIQNYSLWLDIVILFNTILAVIRRKGAY